RRHRLRDVQGGHRAVLHRPRGRTLPRQHRGERAVTEPGGPHAGHAVPPPDHRGQPGRGAAVRDGRGGPAAVQRRSADADRPGHLLPRPARRAARLMPEPPAARGSAGGVPDGRPPAGPVRAGRVRVDCHLHTVASGDSVLTLEELADRARQAGLDAVCVTDHNVTHAAVMAAERDLGVRIIVGEEIRTRDGDVIGLIRGQGGLVYVPHPFDQVRSSLGAVLPALCAEGAVDVIEVFNAKIADPALNARARSLARSFGLPGGAGSDAHDAPGVGAAYLDMPDFDGPASFLAGLAEARVTGEFRDHAPRYPRRPPG